MTVSQISRDLLIFRFRNGIKLIDPNDKTFSMISPYFYPTGYSVSDIMDLSFNFYFLNREGATLLMNEPSVDACGFKSIRDSIGKSLYDVSLKESAKQLIQNCHEVISTHQLKIVEEKNIRKDGSHWQFLSVKLPWYDHADIIIGTMGCSIVLGEQSLAQSLSEIATLGLLNTDKVNTSQNRDQGLSTREDLCVFHLCRGFTLKEIAKKLEISPKTVETYIMRAKQKWHCRNKAELITRFSNTVCVTSKSFFIT